MNTISIICSIAIVAALTLTCSCFIFENRLKRHFQKKAAKMSQAKLNKRVVDLFECSFPLYKLERDAVLEEFNKRYSEAAKGYETIS